MVSIEQFATVIIMLVIEHFEYHTLHFNFANFMHALAMVLKINSYSVDCHYRVLTNIH